MQGENKYKFRILAISVRKRNTVNDGLYEEFNQILFCNSGYRVFVYSVYILHI